MMNSGYEGQCLSWWKLVIFDGLTLNNKLTTNMMNSGDEGQCLSWWKLVVFDGLTLNNKLTLIIVYPSSTLYI